jgi:hypothetical protein
MALITDVADAWSASVTLTADEFWQVRRGPVFLATDAATAPAEETDGLLLDEGDVVALAGGEVVRYRSARADRTGAFVRREKA